MGKNFCPCLRHDAENAAITSGLHSPGESAFINSVCIETLRRSETCFAAVSTARISERFLECYLLNVHRNYAIRWHNYSNDSAGRQSQVDGFARALPSCRAARSAPIRQDDSGAFLGRGTQATGLVPWSYPRIGSSSLILSCTFRTMRIAS